MRHREAPNHAALLAAHHAQQAAGKKRAVRGVGDQQFVRALDDVKAMMKSKAWSEARGMHFVALYADLHFRVYGIEDVSLGPKERVYAAKMAADMLDKDFDGVPPAMMEYVAWTWTREKGREEWRRSNGGKGGLMTWRAQFGRSVLTQYRVQMARDLAAKGAAR